MPSAALADLLERQLADAVALSRGYLLLRDARRMPPGELAALPRAMVVICVSAWEAFVEELVREAVSAVRPASPPFGTWSALESFVEQAVNRFNTPNAQQVRELLSGCLGLPDVPGCWSRQNNSPAQSRLRLQQAMLFRHQIAHGVHPRPVVEHRYAVRLPGFFRYLGERTDSVVRDHLIRQFGIAEPWPE